MSVVSYDYLHCVTPGTDLEDPENGIRNANKDVDSAYSRYEGKINDIVRCVHIRFFPVN
jgi:hypothetical protein